MPGEFTHHKDQLNNSNTTNKSLENGKKTNERKNTHTEPSPIPHLAHFLGSSCHTDLCEAYTLEVQKKNDWLE